jgi:hypothetical protein
MNQPAGQTDNQIDSKKAAETMFSVRFHGRGGQGVVTAAELLAAAAFTEGKYAQAFPSFGSERMGAPVMSFCRISGKQIRTHEPVTEPDALLIQDPTLLHQAQLFDGLRQETGYILDADDGFEELQPRWAPNMVVGLGRLAGGSVGVIANNPLRKAGCLDSLSAEKAARFVRMCDSFGIPLLVLADVPGYLPGVKQEWDGVVRRGAKLLHAFAESTVPRSR